MKNWKSKTNSRAWNSFVKNRRAVLGLVFLVIEICLVIALPVMMGISPYLTDMEAGFYAAPSLQHILGTDAAGRDLFARLLYGGRVSLTVGICATAISVLLGLPLGLLAGYYRGICEYVVMRLAEIFMSFPSMILILVLVAVMKPSTYTVIGVIGVMGWTSIAKLIYGNVVAIRNKEYVDAARITGRTDLDIMFHEILPNAIGPVWVILSFRVGGAILTESGLSFLGVGIQTPQASWGNLINAAQDLTVLMLRPWMWIPPGILIILNVVAFNFIGEGVRDALDPKMIV